MTHTFDALDTHLSMTLSRKIWPFVLVGVLLTLPSCRIPDNAETVIGRAIRAHGAQRLDNAVLEFTFRGERYRAFRQAGVFSYERHYEDSTGSVRDVINNDEILREINGEPQAIDDRTRASILGKVNSIIYFASLPYPLTDPAVVKRDLGPSEVLGTTYDRIEITFRQQGGGPDYRDRFVYWIDSETSLIDYLAYYYFTDETGSRLRKIVNPRDVSGFRAVDHLNYAPRADTLGMRIEGYADLIETDGLDLVSEVRHENVSLRPLE